ncbi:MAG: flagellar basal body-associated FliL family protein [Burkholderiaceae bacterium]|nr:flagellar basal body-associated FliL family protein [Burkholderiaceae bacterium]MCO5105115.1 flagellar basal body-associated FliL family protein [Burkholderiaceae bacterium]
MSTPPVEPEKKPVKSKKLLIIVSAVVLVLLVAGAGVAYVLSQRHALDEDGEEVATPQEQTEPAPVPTFLPVDTMVVNLADPGGERFAQVGITLELADAKTAERVKQFMPSIRSSILLLLSQRTSDELLRRDGKEKLAHDILREVSRPLGFSVPETPPSGALSPAGLPAKDAKGKGKNKAKKNSKGEETDNPVQRVLFSGFIIQ